MKCAILTLLLVLVLCGTSSTQTGIDPNQSDPNEGSLLVQNGGFDYTFKWYGRLGRTYFVQSSPDLLTWTYLDEIWAGGNLVLSQPFETNSDRFFLRLRYTDLATDDRYGADFDGDKVINWEELVFGTDPLHSAYSDSDASADDWELRYGLNPLDATDGALDMDNDGYTNSEEFVHGTDPSDRLSFLDTDSDGLPGAWESARGFNPLDPSDAYSDSDGDVLVTLAEYLNGSDPFDPFNGQPPIVTTYRGDGQIQWAGAILPEPLELRVRNSDGRPIGSVPVHVTIDRGEMSLSSDFAAPFGATANILPDAEGFITLYVRHSQASNTDCQVTATAGLGANLTPVTYTSRILGNPEAVAPPADMRHSWLADGRLRITWQDASFNETEFVIERSIGGESSYRPIARVPANTTQWIDETPASGSDIYYRANSTQ